MKYSDLVNALVSTLPANISYDPDQDVVKNTWNAQMIADFQAWKLVEAGYVISHVDGVGETPHYSDRGFKHFDPIEGSYGGHVRTYESSAAGAPHIWVGVEAEPVHLTLEDAARLRDQLTHLIEHHYQIQPPSQQVSTTCTATSPSSSPGSP